MNKLFKTSNQVGEEILSCENVSKIFMKENVKVSAVKNVSFKIAQGEMVAIVGASGAGKSTLLHILGTLEEPTAGQVRFLGRSLFGSSEVNLSDFRNRHLGFVFQLHYLLPDFSAYENVLMPALVTSLKSKASSEAEKRAKFLLERVGLSRRLSHRPGELSGGEQQRVALARALMNEPDLILADELTGNLDSENSQNIQSLLLELNRDLGITVVIVTHDKNIASQLGRKITMRDGEIVGIEDQNPMAVR